MLTFKPVDRKTNLTKETFRKEYLNVSKPVIFTDLMNDWPAKHKWKIEYLKEQYGNLRVPIYSAKSSKAGNNYMEPDMELDFKEYLEMLEAGPMQYRIFLFNIFKHIPEMCEDFSLPQIMDGWVKGFPFMFFGGAGCKVALHYDIDLSHVFLNQFQGRKRIVLFAPEDSDKIYHLPFTVASYVDINNPDYGTYPALNSVVGYECVLNPGETIFMPSGYWHYIEYLDGGYSMALRSNDSVVTQLKGMFNIARHYVVDKPLNKVMGQQWREIKENMAQNRASKYIH